MDFDSDVKVKNKVIFMNSMIISEDYFKKIKDLNLPEKKENNEYILLHVYGDDKRASSKFNVKVYNNKKGILKVVCNDIDTLNKMIENKQDSPPDNVKRTISIDDSGWGFPLGGVLVGAYDTLTNQIITRDVTVNYFQNPLFSQKEYLVEYARRGLEIIKELHAEPIDTVIKICSGYINSKLKEKLREEGFYVEVTEIKEPLQSELEKKHKEYVKGLGFDYYYDPKGLSEKEIVSKFDKVILIIKEKGLMHLSKTGWQYFKE
ncbi:MAG: hypothetical protein V1859_02360 [archaeon]